MSTADTTGVASLAAILVALAGGESPTVASLAAGAGIKRASAFAVVRKLEAAGLVVREGGQLLAGPDAVRLGLSAFGLAPLAGPAEALLTLLRDDTDGTAALAAGETPLLRIAAGWDNGSGDPSPTLVAPIGGGRATLTLTLRPMATRVARALAQTEFDRIRLSLDHYLDKEPN